MDAASLIEDETTRELKRWLSKTQQVFVPIKTVFAALRTFPKSDVMRAVSELRDQNKITIAGSWHEPDAICAIGKPVPEDD